MNVHLHAMNWQFHSFGSLDTSSLFALMKLRVDVFVVEQACAYAELDCHDTNASTLHLLGYDDQRLVAYARAMPFFGDTELSDFVRIGRVVVASTHRRQGIATCLMEQMLQRLDNDYPVHDQVLASQCNVQDFYRSMGFSTESPVYLEDGIAHIDMRRKRST